MKQMEIENIEISEASWTKMEKLSNNTINQIEVLHHDLQNNNELPTILPQSSFQPEASDHNRQSVILEDAQVPQET